MPNYVRKNSVVENCKDQHTENGYFSINVLILRKQGCSERFISGEETLHKPRGNLGMSRDPVIFSSSCLL